MNPRIGRAGHAHNRREPGLQDQPNQCESRLPPRYQAHQRWPEHWVVIFGVATFTNDHEIILACQEMSVGVLVGAKRRLANQAAEELVVEAQHGRHTGSDAIVRTEDD